MGMEETPLSKSDVERGLGQCLKCWREEEELGLEAEEGVSKK